MESFLGRPRLGVVVNTHKLCDGAHCQHPVHNAQRYRGDQGCCSAIHGGSRRQTARQTSPAGMLAQDCRTMYIESMCLT